MRAYYQQSTYEVIVQAFTRSPQKADAPLVEEGDIISVCREGSRDGVGRAMMHNYVHLRLWGLDDGEMDMFDQPVAENGTIFQTRRYCIPLERLQKISPLFDPTKARDPNVIHQPFCAIDEGDHHEESGAIDPLQHKVDVGWYRLPTTFPMAPERSQTTMTLEGLPAGYTYDVPWFRRDGTPQAQVIQEFGGHYESMRKWMAAEMRNTMSLGPLVHVMDPKGKSVDADFSFTISYLRSGPGVWMHKRPALPVWGLVYDKQLGRYL